MIVIKPFKAIRPAAEYAEKVVTLPYDVMDRKEAEEMAKGNPYSFLRVARSEIDLPEIEDAYDKSVYEKASENLQDMISKSVMKQDEEASLYIYREIWNGNVQTGIVGCASVDDYAEGKIKEHEKTRVVKEQDRISHISTVNANTGLVFFAYRQNQNLKAMLENYISENVADADVMGPGEVRHQVWQIKSEALTNDIIKIFAEMDAVYVADGHHRAAAAHKVALSRRAADPYYTGDEEYNYFMAAYMPDEDLNCLDYNRVIEDFNGLSKEEFFDKVKKAGFDIEKMGTEIYKPSKPREFSVIIDHEWYKLNARPEIIKEDVVDGLDVAILQDNILGPILDIDDPRSSSRIDFVGGIRGPSELVRRTETDSIMGIAVYPASMAELFAVADAGKTMPPKSTWFEPKLASGLFVHSIASK